jgi:surfeit locus 1 family protein
MVFRPLPVMSVLGLIALAILLALGVWQWQRADWKRGLFAQYEAAFAAAPVPLDQVLCAPDAGETPRRITLLRPPPQADGAVLRLYGFDLNGEPGWRLMQAVSAPACSPKSHILLQTGFEPMPRTQSAPIEARLPDSYPALPSLKLVQLNGQSAFSARNEPAANAWYTYDSVQMAQALKVAELSPFMLFFVGETMPAGLNDLSPARHIGYSLTWFGLALSLLVIYLAYHARVGRLRLTGSAKKA